MDWPVHWTAFGPVEIKGIAAGWPAQGLPDRGALLPGEMLKSIPEELVIGGDILRGQRVELDAGRRLDLGALYGSVGRGKAAYLLASIEIEADTKARLGAGADWFMQWWLNGEPVYDTLSAGNEASPITTANHVFELDLKAGTNVLAVAVVSGSGGFSVAVGDPAAQEVKGPNIPAYERAMTDGRAKLNPRTGSAFDNPPLDFAGAREDFRMALEVAGTAVERAEARLAIADGLLHDYRQQDASVLRRAYAAVLDELADVETDDRRERAAIRNLHAEAHLGMGKTFQREQEYGAARAQFETAVAGPVGPMLARRAQLAVGRSYVQERRLDRARQELERMLEMEHANPAVRMDWEADALLRAVDVVQRLRSDRPRLFFNAETWPAVSERALTVEKKRLEQMASSVRAWASNPIVRGDWGMRAMQAAFVYRVTGDPEVLETTRKMLRAGVDHYLLDRPSRVSSYSRIGWLAAFDWVHDALEQEERDALARDMLDYVRALFLEDRVQNWRVHRLPHYYERDLFWYAGLALLDPFADDLDYLNAFTAIAVGYGHNRVGINDRVTRAGNDGAWHLNAGYYLRELATCYSWPFIYTWVSATGTDIPDEWSSIGVPPEYALRQIANVRDRFVTTFGYSRTMSAVGSDLLYDHMGQFMHFFGSSHPEHAAIAHYVRQRIGEEAGSSAGEFPIFPFLLTDLEQAPPPEIPPDLPPARHYENVGLVLMSSGFAPGDTYALFAVGGGLIDSNHLDATHFTLYRDGFLALDSGCRPHSGKHYTEYYYQTVAHNAVLIHMPGETFPGLESNAGGQNKGTSRAKVLAFETDRLYTYAATDATDTYHEDKCARMVRQFIYIQPDVFVVFDRVVSTRAEYPKRWLLHTSHEPLVSGKAFRADSGEGRIFCRTLLPADAVVETIGGPGKEFWAAGRNWALPDGWWETSGRGQDPDAAGRWRVEVSPGAAREEDHFLHLIQVSDPSVEAMLASNMTDGPDEVEITFAAGGRAYAITLRKTGAVGGHIRIVEDGRILADRPLTEEIMPQSGLAAGSSARR